MATIYKKESKRPLSSYQRRINEAAQELCLKNPGFLHQKKLLMEEARKKIIDEGFQFVKGKSRSKRCANSDNTQPTSKRQRTSKDMRDERMKNIEEDCKDLNDRISYKEKRIRACENISDYKKCDELKEEISVLKQQRRELKAELKRIMKSNYQSKWYFQKRAKEASLTESDASLDRSRSTTPLPSRSTTPLPQSSSEIQSVQSSPASTPLHEGSANPSCQVSPPFHGSSQHPSSPPYYGGPVYSQYTSPPFDGYLQQLLSPTSPLSFGNPHNSNVRLQPAFSNWGGGHQIRELVSRSHLRNRIVHYLMLTPAIHPFLTLKFNPMILRI